MIYSNSMFKCLAEQILRALRKKPIRTPLFYFVTVLKENVDEIIYFVGFVVDFEF